MKHIPLLLCLCAALTACSARPNASGINDPHESVNRAIHDSNLLIDRSVVKPVSTAYGKVVPNPLRRGLNNVADTLSLPNDVVNDVLQFQLGDAVHNTVRFTLNATVGILGLWDPATKIGLEKRDTDFGETLHTWGVGEGSYVVLPFYGASTTRDTAGLLVDFVLDPIGTTLTTAGSQARTGVTVAELADTRYRFSDLYESIVYDSADGYSQLRLTYLDARRFELGTDATQSGGTDAADETFDIYEDFYE